MIAAVGYVLDVARSAPALARLHPILGGGSSQVFASDGVYSNALEAARKFAHGPRAALRAAKIAVNWGARGDFRAGIVLERELFADLFSTEDQKTGMQSLLDQGPGKAKFVGR